MVISATPPGFRPCIYNAAIKAGKHVFMEKPCCVDAPGFNLLMETNKLAEEKGLKVGVGFQRRHTPELHRDRREDPRRRARQDHPPAGLLERRRHLEPPPPPGMTEMEYQVNNWYHFAWLSGDNICEQHIHNLDVCNWVMDDHPVEANGMGGCTGRYIGECKGTGQIFDHHFVEFTYKSGAKLFSQCRHIPRYLGPGRPARSTGPKASPACPAASTNRPRQGRGKGRKSLFGDSMVQEHHDLISAIKNNEKYVEGWHGATSSMTAVLGRMATYSGQVVRWDDLVAKGTSEFPTQLAWDAPAPVKKDADGNYPIPMPGVYRPY